MTPSRLREAYAIEAADVEGVELEVFDVAFDIISGGKEGAKNAVATKDASCCDHRGRRAAGQDRGRRAYESAGRASRKAVFPGAGSPQVADSR
jgi:hypothetical protein